MRPTTTSTMASPAAHRNLRRDRARARRHLKRDQPVPNVGDRTPRAISIVAKHHGSHLPVQWQGMQASQASYCQSQNKKGPKETTTPTWVWIIRTWMLVTICTVAPKVKEVSKPRRRRPRRMAAVREKKPTHPREHPCCTQDSTHIQLKPTAHTHSPLPEGMAVQRAPRLWVGIQLVGKPRMSEVWQVLARPRQSLPSQVQGRAAHPGQWGSTHRPHNLYHPV